MDTIEPTPKTTRELLAELAGTTCQCGNVKAKRQTFCRSCYFGLSPKLRNALYNRIGEGYEQAYAKAVAVLNGPC